MRYAIYFTPPRDHPLTAAAAAWLGRNAFTGADPAAEAADGLSAEEIDRLVAEPRRYGFHATIVAPFRLADGRTEYDLAEALRSFCAACVPFDIAGLKVARLGSFMALVPAHDEPGLSALAARAVETFLPFRAPLDEAELRRRDPSRLSARQAGHLATYGYPYVMDEFRFHMTLSSSLDPDALARIEPVLQRRFGALAAARLQVGGLALFIEPQPGAPFLVHAYEHFPPAEARKSA